MADVLCVTTREIGNPVTVCVQMIPDDAPPHCAASQRDRSEAHSETEGIGSTLTHFTVSMPIARSQRLKSATH